MEIKKYMKQKIDLDIIKSDFFLKIIFNYFKKDKSLQIFRCNKQMQKRLNLSIKDYKEYSETFTPIEIEIIPIKIIKNECVTYITLIDKKDY